LQVDETPYDALFLLDVISFVVLSLTE